MKPLRPATTPETNHEAIARALADRPRAEQPFPVGKIDYASNVEDDIGMIEPLLLQIENEMPMGGHALQPYFAAIRKRLDLLREVVAAMRWEQALSETGVDRAVRDREGEKLVTVVRERRFRRSARGKNAKP